ncbi:hypothetical protein [Paraburkholderia sp. MM5477-R1]|uniref:hypothetical protein n=1 Tax=Paraburkholderia sp. MM5477-R1 TaxID=2991062 RepID=UPI003D1D3823
MSEVTINAVPKRGPGRPRKQHVDAQSVPDAVSAPPPVPAAVLPEDVPPRAVTAPPPLTDEDIAMVDRKGAAKMLGKSLVTITWLEVNDPDFPAPFTLGKNNFYFLTHDLRVYVLTKAAQAKARKQEKLQGTPR